MTQIQLPAPAATLALVSNLQANLRDFGRMVDRHGHPAPALRQLGLVHWENGRLDKAAQAFSAALSLMPDDAALWRDLAGVYTAMGQTDQVLAAIFRALELDPDNAQSWLILAGAADQQNNVNAAEAGYRRAIALHPTAAAYFGLGLLLFRQKRYDSALAAMEASIRLEPANASAHYALGHLHFIAFEFAKCIASFDNAARLGLTLDQQSRQKQVRAATFQVMIEGNVQEALRLYPEIAGADCEDLDHITRDAFSVLSAMGHLETAAEVGRIRLAEMPDDPVRQYLLDAVTGRALTAAPTDYIERYFDQFAPQFDSKLVETLQYRGFSQIAKLVSRHQNHFTCALDLGCGTGLASGDLAQLAQNLVGVDISSGMLAEAEKRGDYAELVRSEAVAYLQTTPQRFDLIFAADSLIYFGDLGPVVRAAAFALTPGGLFALSIEVSDSDAYKLLPSGRFAHSPEYLKATATDFAILECVESDIRLEAGRPVKGLYVVMKRR